jgi:hypothetical protein
MNLLTYHVDIPIITDKYAILGVFKKDSATPKETAVLLNDPDLVSIQLHKGVVSLLGFGRFLSLKELAGFGLYKVG